jgi:hypothetical protein
MKRLLVLLAACVVAGCGGTARPRTTLTIFAENDSVGRALFHLRCAPAGGDLPDTRRACAALATDPSLVTRPRPFICFGGTFSWWDVRIDGRLRGRTLHRAFSTCWTPQMPTIGRLGLTWQELRSHLEPRRRARVLPGVAQTLTGLRPGDLVTCDILGHHLQMGVPSSTGFGPASVGVGGGDVPGATLALARHTDGTVVASCRSAPPPTRFVYCGVARTVNGFDLVAARGLFCRAARTAVVRIERDVRGPWLCSRAMHAGYELACAAGRREVRVLERSPVGLNREPGGVVSTYNWSWRVLHRRLEARQDGGGWIDLGPPPWCIPFDAPREVLLALHLRSTTADGGCFARPRAASP